MRERGGKNNWKIFLGKKRSCQEPRYTRLREKQVLRGDQEFIIGSVIMF